MQNTKKKLLTITNLKKYFPVGKEKAFSKNQLYVRANDDISLDIYEGETLGLVGESGCGKSTFGRVLLQLYPQTAGSTMYYGRTLDEMAPKYVGKTLKNASKMVAHYHEAQKKADEALKKYEEAGENVTHEQSNEKDRLVTEAENALNHTAKILGGFMACNNIEEPAKVLYDAYEDKVKLFQLKKQREQQALRTAKKDKKGNVNEKAVAKLSEMDQQIEELTKKCAEANKKVEQEKEKYRSLPDFAKYEALKDEGVDLSRLTYSEIRHLRKDLQIIFQDPYSSLNPRMTVEDIIGEPLDVHKLYTSRGERRDKILHLMELVGLNAEHATRYAHEFSGGQRQRIGIARALATNPRFIVCDEAVSALDVSIQAQVINMFEELQEKLGVAYLFIAHDLLVVHHISDRIAVMYLGRIVEIADSNELNDNPMHPYTQSLLSAVPYPDPKMAKERQRIVLEGDVPSPLHMPSGCAFRTRCRYATEKCAQECPSLTDRGNGHQVACWNK